MKLFPVAAVCAALFTISISQTAFADSASDEDLKAIRKSLDEIKASQADLNKQIQEIKTQLKAMPSPAKPTPAAQTSAAQQTTTNPVAYINNVPFDLGSADDRSTGPKDAKVVMMEFSDLQCPFCAYYHTHAFQDIMTSYVATGKIRYVFRDFPIASHPNEMKFAQATRYAADKGKFWDAHDYIYRHQDKVNGDNITTQIATLGLDVNELNACLKSGSKVAAINKDSMDGMKIGATSTPSLFIAVADSEDKVKVVRKIKGAKPSEVFRGALDEVLASVKAQEKK